ncbi:peptidase M56 BlaR1 [Paenibacillus sp. 32O-W]|uniref:peptidase M56 BlaR1 n=1 Tax=Paenibacillus sp. 32O-W TaxID=1695218 RepID=UPI0011A35B65|nr:peptidase M56 BlaR1 [Paenibacillus sp. 32O-W]
MKNISLLMRVMVTCFVFVVGIAVGSLAIQPTSADSNITKPVFPKNNKGQTYGSAANVKSSDEEPDLIEAIGIDGNIGYVLKKDLEEDMPKSPEEAVARTKAKQLAGNIRYIPLYESDGETVIGKFRIQSGGETFKN